MEQFGATLAARHLLMVIGLETFQRIYQNSGMSLEISVDGYPGYKANKIRGNTLDENTFEITAVDEQWRSPDAAFFQVRTATGKRYLLR
jgi:hypothetical protein